MNDEQRPTPEQMLARLRAESPKQDSSIARGKLRLFFGYAAGVGKTFAMLQTAHAMQREGRDVVIGYVEPHARPETQALTAGLTTLPPLTVAYRGTLLTELDLDAILERKPELVLIDELAHTNAPGSRHVKRWQDVEELLSSGIHVYSTLNVQHIESLNDVIAEVSGVQVRETVPDAILQQAEEVTLIDVAPDELLERLRQGKVYLPGQAAYALQQFFRKNNLVALRELALRHTADYVHEEVETARLGAAAKRPWPTQERLLVCVGPSPTSAKVIRAAKRLADRLNAPWMALHVKSTATLNRTSGIFEQVRINLRLAESLGAEVVQIPGEEVSQELLAYASNRNVTKIVIGKTADKRPRFWQSSHSLVDRLLRDSGNMDVVVVRGLDEPQTSSTNWTPTGKNNTTLRWFETLAYLASATGLTLMMHKVGFTEANLVMVFLLAIVATAARCGNIPSIVVSVGSVLLFDLLFVEPYYRLSVHDGQYLVTFAVMLAVGLVASSLTSRVRFQAEIARRNERRTEALYRLSRRLVYTAKTTALVQATEQIISEVFDAHAVIYLPDHDRKLRPVLGHFASFAASAKEFAAAQWVFDHNEPAGIGTHTLPSAESLYLPLSTPTNVAGVIGIQPIEAKKPLSLDERLLLESCASQIAIAIERSHLAERSQRAELESETEKLRNSLLSAVSHDLRTPLAVIAGAASSLDVNIEKSALGKANRALFETIVDESERLTRVVDNLLNMTRLTSGVIQINRQWQPVEEVIGSALHRLQHQLHERQVKVKIDGQLPLVHGDDVLLETVIVNLMDNALKYSPDRSPIEITATSKNNEVVISVMDRGCGIIPGDEKKIFEKFHRGTGLQSDRRGTGLGLAICSAIIAAHQGTIMAKNREGGGTIVQFTIPNNSAPPAIPLEADQ